MNPRDRQILKPRTITAGASGRAPLAPTASKSHIGVRRLIRSVIAFHIEGMRNHGESVRKPSSREGAVSVD